MNEKARRTLTVSGRRTRVRLEPEFWQALDDIGRRETLSVSDLVTFVRRRDPKRPMTATLRLFITTYFRSIAEQAGDRGGRRWLQ